MNYLPVVGFEDWVKVDGFDILVDRVRMDAGSRLESALQNVGLSQEIVEAIGFESVISQIDNDPNIKKKNIESLKDIQKLRNRLDGNFSQSSSKISLYRDFPKITKALTNELVKNRLSGFYFIPNFRENENTAGYVTLLREPSSMPFELAKRISKGLALEDAKGDLSIASHISFNSVDFAMPVSKIASPHIEHMLQTFAMLYGRIGLPDLPDTVAKLPEKSLLEA